MKLFNLTGKVALVTGGNGGIGLSMAKALGEAGAKIIIAGRNESKNSESMDKLTNLGVDCISLKVDVTNENSCDEMIEKSIAHFGKLNILINVEYQRLQKFK